MKKKIFATVVLVVLVCAFVFALTACNNAESIERRLIKAGYEVDGGYIGGESIDSEEEIQGLPVYRDEGTPTAIKAEETCLSKYLDNETGEMLLLAFPDTGKHEKECREFVDFLSGEEGAQFCRQ